MALTDNPSAEITERLARVVFTSPNASHRVQDILDFAWFLGVLQPLAREVQVGRARQESAAAQGLEADLAAITHAADEFRYERDLLTAEEAEAWLADRDVSQLQFSESFTRKYWCARLEEPSEDGVPSPPYPELAHPELMRAESILSGDFDRVVTSLSWRMATVVDRGGKPLPDPNAALAAALDRFFERTEFTEEGLPAALEQASHDRAWLDRFLEIEAVYLEYRKTVVTDQQRARVLPALRLGLIRVEFEATTVPNLNAAREAALCLREGEMTIDEIAAQFESEVHRNTVFLEDLPEELQQSFISAGIGGVLEPKAEEGGIPVTRILHRLEPDLNDEEVRYRVDERLLSTYFEALAGKYIKVVYP